MLRGIAPEANLNGCHFSHFSVRAMQVAPAKKMKKIKKCRGGEAVMQRGVLELSRWTIWWWEWRTEAQRKPTWEARLLKEFQKGREVSAHVRLWSKWWGERLGELRRNWLFQAKLIRAPAYSTWVHWLIASAVEDNRCSPRAREPENQARSLRWN